MIIDYENLEPLQEEKTVFVAGVFDLLHPGHVFLFEQIKNQFPDYLLIVGVMCDKRVKALKGEGRPIMDEEQRVKMAESIKYVDYAFIYPFDDLTKPNWYEVPEKLKPEYIFAEVGSPIDAEKLRKMGTKLIHFNKELDISTTKIIERIKKGA